VSGAGGPIPRPYCMEQAEYSPQILEYIRTQILPPERVKQGDRWVDAGPATHRELEEFLLKAKVYGLDPLRGQISATRRDGRLICAPTIDGMRYLVARTGEYDSQDLPQFGPEVKPGIPEWCTVTVYRKGCSHGTPASCAGRNTPGARSPRRRAPCRTP
jgi:hypothetical protein